MPFKYGLDGYWRACTRTWHNTPVASLEALRFLVCCGTGGRRLSPTLAFSAAMLLRCRPALAYSGIGIYDLCKV
jgi:hypothetical protein